MNRYAQRMQELRFEAIYAQKGSQPIHLEEEDLRHIERELGHPLPADYREFLRDYGGTEFHGAWFPLRRNDYLEEGGIYTFFGSTEEDTLADNYHQHRAGFGILEDGYAWYPGLRLVRDISVPVAEMEWPEELLPIGCDSQGNPICLALFGLRPGAIFYWSHTLLDADNVYLAADSFDEFMHLLEPISEK